MAAMSLWQLYLNEAHRILAKQDSSKPATTQHRGRVNKRASSAQNKASGSGLVLAGQLVRMAKQVEKHVHKTHSLGHFIFP